MLPFYRDGLCDTMVIKANLVLSNNKARKPLIALPLSLQRVGSLVSVLLYISLFKKKKDILSSREFAMVFFSLQVHILCMYHCHDQVTGSSRKNYGTWYWASLFNNCLLSNDKHSFLNKTAACLVILGDKPIYCISLIETMIF